MQTFMKREYLSYLLLAIAIIGILLGLVEMQEENNWVSACKFFINTDKIESIVVYDNINDEEVTYIDKVEIQKLVELYRYQNWSIKARRVKKGYIELLYSITVYLSEDWVEEMEVYYTDKEIYWGQSRHNVSFKLNNKNCLLLFRGRICSIDVITE